MYTHRGIIFKVVLGLYSSIRTLWYEKFSIWGWIGTVLLVIFVDKDDSFAHGNLEQKNAMKTKIMKIKKIKSSLVQNLYHIMMSE